MRSDVIVSLTSWKGRINTVSKTIFSIYSQCDCKIVLTLSTEEFPNKEKANSFEVPSWFGEEITYDKSYKNKNLASTFMLGNKLVKKRAKTN